MAQFFMNGASFATWGVQIPVLKAAFGASEAQMSIAMLCVAAGAVLAMKHVGSWVARVGSARALTRSSFVYAAALLAIPLAGRFALMLPILAVFGMAMAAFDVAMNVQAAQVETRLDRPIMSTMHGMFSVGGMAGAAFGGAMLAAGVSPRVHLAIVAALLCASALYASSRLLADPPAEHDEASPGGAGIPRVLWILGGIAFLGLVCEGAMYDWAAIYLRDVTGASLDTSSYGYALFSAGMALGRFSADPLRRRLSVPTILCASAWLGFAGITLAIAVPLPAASLAGFALMGLGVANFMPFFFLAGTRLPGMSAAAGVAGVGRFAYAGMLFGPPLIGALTHATSLRGGLAAISVTMGAIALLGIRQVAQVLRDA
ncbi:MFS transporter [Burkholderia gladioli]|uniref:MFS transporter n=1 Tax=Burkholderia gladioli TaxID=28095 RepID=UPI00264AAC11|nr:MFS transporter [Burkholderia gladioli]MDN7720342.1 MFS transporter [Burkholderia gladioli]